MTRHIFHSDLLLLFLLYRARHIIVFTLLKLFCLIYLRLNQQLKLIKMIST